MISFACSHCGLKLKVKEKYAGRKSSCPTCKRPIVVPMPDKTPALVPADKIEGLNSSLARAGVDAGVNLGQDGTRAGAARAGQKSVRELLARRGKAGERYLVEGEIARGGMGAVLRAVDCDIRREVAVKYMLDQADPRKKARFVEEAQITGQLEHPNIVPIHELGIDSRQRLFFSMKMVKGRSLAQVLEELRGEGEVSTSRFEKEYPLARLLNIFVNVCNALAYAHSQGVIHRDLKPANIMVGDFGEVYVMDWGLAKALGQESEVRGQESGVRGQESGTRLAATRSLRSGALESDAGSQKSEDGAESQNKPGTKVMTSREPDADLTQEGAILGTPVYMPPEQASGRLDAVDPRSDIYSLGAILYELLTLAPPVAKEGGHLAILMRVVQGEIVPPQQRNAQRAKAGKIPGELSAVAMKALAKEPAQRYQQVEDLRRDLERFQEGRSVSAKEDTKWEMAVKFVKRNKGISAATIAGLSILAVVLFFSFKINYEARVRAERNYSAYLKEQEEKRIQGKKAVPAFVEMARLWIEQKKFDEALAQLSAALDIDPEHAEGRLLRAQLFVSKKDLPRAREELDYYLRLKPEDGEAAKLADLCRKGNADDPAFTDAVLDLLVRQKLLSLAESMAQSRGQLYRVVRKRLELALPVAILKKEADGKFSLNLTSKDINNLGPLKDLPINILNLSGNPFQDLTPLKGMPLTSLILSGCKEVRDLTPLKDTPLNVLSLAGCIEVRDLTPLADMPLASLNLSGCSQLQDLTLLKSLPLVSLNLTACHQVHDLTLLKGMALNSLRLERCKQLRDLTPLKGMKLTALDLAGCPIQDLTPLANMPLNSLMLSNSGVRDLTPLKGMRLTALDLLGCKQVTDLTPLEGMSLKEIHFTPRSSLKGVEVLRPMSSLKTIGTSTSGPAGKMSAELFWKKYDAGEYNR